MKRLIALAVLLCACINALAWPLMFRQGHFRQGFLATGANRATSSGGGASAGYSASLYAYYKFDESSSPVVDSAHGRNLSSASCGAVASSSGFIGTSHQINCYAGHSSPKLNLQRNDDGTANFDFTSSFTVRLWLKTSITGNADFRNIVGDDTWNIYMGTGSSDHKVELFISSNGTDTDLESIQTVNDGNWHRILAWWDSSNGEAGIQIDDNTPATTTQSDRFTSSSTTFLIGDNFGDSPDIFLDELGLWTYAMPTDDRTYDWNSGAGLTLP